MGNKFNYKNPVPSVNDKRQSKRYSICFNFKEEVTLEEAIAGINNLLRENGGVIPEEWVEMGSPVTMRYALPQE